MYRRMARAKLYNPIDIGLLTSSFDNPNFNFDVFMWQDCGSVQ